MLLTFCFYLSLRVETNINNNLKFIVMETKTRYTMVNKRGEEIYHSNSFLGFIGSTILVYFMTFFAIMFFAMILCGIGSIFS